MELIKAIKEKSHIRKENDIRQQAEYLITVADFDSSLYIAYADTPLIPIEESWTSKEILQELSKIRPIGRELPLNMDISVFPDHSV